MIAERAIAELERTRANLLQVGTVAEADYASARVRVLIAGLTSAWLPWTTQRAGGDRSWAAPEVGEQVLVACPDGDPAQGVVLGAIYQADYAAPASSPDITRTTYQDGAVIEYDRASHTLTATLPEGGTVNVTAPQVVVTAQIGVTLDTPLLLVTGAISTGSGANGGATIYGDIQQVNGSFSTDGDVISDGDQVAGSVSQQDHRHTDVTPGGGLSGPPEQ